MVISNFRSKRKATGGRYRNIRNKRLKDAAGRPTLTQLGETKKRSRRVRGGNIKNPLLAENIANVYDPKQKKHVKTEITTILECPANRNYVRRNIMTKGTVIETKAGKARVTSRPGQDGVIDAVLV